MDTYEPDWGSWNGISISESEKSQYYMTRCDHQNETNFTHQPTIPFSEEKKDSREKQKRMCCYKGNLDSCSILSVEMQ